jgi:hypothetical protein
MSFSKIGTVGMPGMRRHLAIGAARGWSWGSLELQPDDSLKNKIG